MGWNDWTRDAEIQNHPDIPDDLYEAEVVEVSEPKTEANRFKKQPSDPDQVTQFCVTWDLISGDVPEGTWFFQWISLPDRYITEGFLSSKSWLYKTMDALGYDMTERFRVNPPEWKGKKARLTIANAAPEGDPNGTVKPRLKGLMKERTTERSRRTRETEAAAPVGAGRGTLRERLAVDEEAE